MLNKCSFIGNLGRDPECRSLGNGKEVVSLSLGVSEKWKDASGEKKEHTEWVRITIFNEHLVKVAKDYLKKGSKIYVEGKLQTKKYTDKDGVEKYSTEIALQNYGGTIVMLDGKKDAAPSETDKAYAHAETALKKAAQLDDEIPF